MIDNYIYKLNVNPFWGSLLMKSFYKGYMQSNCSISLHFLILPMILPRETRLLLASWRLNLGSLAGQNPLLINSLQENIWKFNHITKLSLIHLNNTKSIILKSDIEILETIDYKEFDTYMQEYLKPAYSLGILFRNMNPVDIYKSLNVIP